MDLKASPKGLQKLSKSQFQKWVTSKPPRSTRTNKQNEDHAHVLNEGARWGVLSMIKSMCYKDKMDDLYLHY